jgi:hypothetical protein
MGKGGSVSVSQLPGESETAMPEVAPGNPGALPEGPAGPAGKPAGEAAVLRRVRVQVKLHRWAGEDSSRRLGDLFNLVCSLRHRCASDPLCI